ncbi:DinB family protein [Oceanihabitans sediminis]|uniref:DinB family protein n=1 Tax=Oceanihabitans sediminis TaxID=1812012 RepID=A0A368P6D5_9FLAO|nr:DinB family protein [Oceanihabitans sediminis]MDX1773595.1 DinB family protein [Oceanihabitans sediminis]RBP33039.1 DinB family protein [Oceanihabitans sediminis]RCU57445.1 DinB family protein [Oceanihabitans sediminis]
MKVSQLQKEEYHTFYQTYIDKAGDLDLLEGLEFGFKETLELFESIPNEVYDYAYAEGKWTIKELLQHIIDTERVFAYRALCFARKERAVLPGFNEDDYADCSFANRRTKDDLLEEYVNVRKSTISLFRSFSDDMLFQNGVASDVNITVRAIGFILVGHEKHHCMVVAERYL